jgi:hypothetical protein
MATKPQLKQFGDLASADFAQHPIWIACHTADYGEPWYEETDEETFRPWSGPLPAGPEEGILLVSARMLLSDGRDFPGFITPQHETQSPDLGIIQPHLFLPSGRTVGFWGGMFGYSKNELKSFYAEMGADPKDVFPISFSAEVGLARGRTSGTVPGFCWQPKDTVEVHL